MSEKMNFADLDAAVSDLIARTSDDGASSSDRDEIARAEAGEFPRTAGALAEKFAKSEPGAKNGKKSDFADAKNDEKPADAEGDSLSAAPANLAFAKKSPVPQSFIANFLSGEKREDADNGAENLQKSFESTEDSDGKEMNSEISFDEKKPSKNSFAPEESMHKNSPSAEKSAESTLASAEKSAKSRARANANFEPATHFRGRFMDIIPPRATAEAPENLAPTAKKAAPKIEKFAKITEGFATTTEESERNSEKTDGNHDSALENFATEFESEIEKSAADDKNPDENTEKAADEKPDSAEKSDVSDAYDSPFLPDANAKVSKRPLGQTNFATPSFATPSFETELPSAPTESDLSEDNFITKFLHDEHENAKNAPAASKTASENFALTSDFSSGEARAAVANVANPASQSFPTPAKNRGKSVAFAWILVLVLFIAIGVAAGASLYFSGAFQR